MTIRMNFARRAALLSSALLLTARVDDRCSGERRDAELGCVDRLLETGVRGDTGRSASPTVCVSRTACELRRRSRNDLKTARC